MPDKIIDNNLVDQSDIDHMKQVNFLSAKTPSYQIYFNHDYYQKLRSLHPPVIYIADQLKDHFLPCINNHPKLWNQLEPTRNKQQWLQIGFKEKQLSLTMHCLRPGVKI